MGVTGLWAVVQPCARPIKIETLNKKRLAVDASIWIYQFLKAVRDKEGNALRNSHVVGFFRRICKLLFIGIKPVFVFDGGAPALKRQTISGRKQRREGRREDAVRTAGKLLALQMQRRAEEEEQTRKEASKQRTNADAEEALPDNVAYAAESHMTPQERQQSRKFKKKDQYDLPDLDVSMSEMGGRNDPRVMSLEELEEYARQFNAGEDINIYDFSKIDFNSAFFMSLPPSDRYNILNAARLRSRLRMGYSKDQLDTMFPDRMAFSKFQVERVAERNELTQRLMRVNGMGDDASWTVDGSGRVSGEKGREYVLVKNESAEGGWALGVIGDKTEGERDKPIDVDRVDEDKFSEAGDENMSDEDNFEDVPVEGLNRLPKSMLKRRPAARKDDKFSTKDILKQREALYKSRMDQIEHSAVITDGEGIEEDENQLFYSERGAENDAEEESDDDQNLQKAIAMSIQPEALGQAREDVSDGEEDDYAEVFGGAKAEASILTGFSSQQQNAGHQKEDDTPEDDDDDDEFDLGRALAESNKPRQTKAANTTSAASKSQGPLPFESLDLGSSILGKKLTNNEGEKSNAVEEQGGFMKDSDFDKEAAKPLPPWFSKNEDVRTVKSAEKDASDGERRQRQDNGLYEFTSPRRIRRQETQEVIDIDELEDKQPETIEVASDQEVESVTPEESSVVVQDSEVRMGDLADKVRAPSPKPKPQDVSKAQLPEDAGSPDAYEWEESDVEDAARPAGGTFQPADEKEPSLEVEFEDASDPKPDATPAAEPTDENEEDEFEDVPLNNARNIESKALEEDDDGPVPASGGATDDVPPTDDFDDLDLPSDPEEDELMRRLAAEAEEHARFASQLNNKSYSHNIEEYESELKALRNQQKKDRRDADEVTQIMVQECQQLLKLFGIPFITAPMEAEAQCAELVSLGLVDGIVTDDSDIFLFGGTRIYKNMFNQAKYVECYLSSDLDRDFDLTRPRLIRLAHLLGSDYTEGIPGVGPVNALEIVAEFPDGLEEFRDWWSAVQTNRAPTADDGGSAFRKKFRRNATRVFLPPNFPDQRVDLAYLKPEVDSDPSAFQWGIPDLDALRAFLMATIGWSQERTDEVLVPVIRDMNRREHEGTQANITHFLGAGSAVGAGAFAPRVVRDGKSKRMETALERMAARARDKKRKRSKPAAEQGDEDDVPEEYVDPEDAVIAVPGSAVDEQMSGSTPKRRGKPVRMADLALMEDEEDEDEAPQSTSASRKKGKKKKKSLKM